MLSRCPVHLTSPLCVQSRSRTTTFDGLESTPPCPIGQHSHSTCPVSCPHVQATVTININNINKMLSYRRETALQGALQFSPKVEDWNWETICYGHYRSIFNHNRPENLSNSVKKKTQNKGYYGVQGHSKSSRSVPIESTRMRFPISD